MNFKQKFKENKGITLIALVVTIIVLLILAGISIAMLTGQNGILNRATEAKNTTGTTQVDEQVKLSVAEALSNGLGTITEDNLKKALDSNVGSGKYELTGDAVNGWTIKAADKTYNISGKGEISGGNNGGNSGENTGGGTENGGTTGGNTSEEIEFSLNETQKTLSIDGEDKGYFTLKAIFTKGSGTVTWENSNTGAVAVEGTGNSIKVKALAEGEATITASCKGKTATCNVKVENVVSSEYIDDSYVEYNVSYTDVDTETEYTNLTGWRVLNKVDNGDGTSNLDIISTGIPAGLYYNTGYIKDATYSPWAGTAKDITNYISRYYTSGSNTYENMYAASGLRYNFEKIKFKKQSGDTTYYNDECGSGYYTEISKNGTAQTGEIDGKTFKARNNVEVRSVIHSDITGNEKTPVNYADTVTDPADKKGIFILQNYTPDKHTSGAYWLASPDLYDYAFVLYVYYSGSVDHFNGCMGVRPVVSMTNVKMQRKAGNSHVWEIVD